MKREFVPLAHSYGIKHSITRKFASIKLDGERAIWVPPSAGRYKKDVPFSNKPTKWRARDSDHVATGLWTRNGNIIHAPIWFLDKLPVFPVDLELYAGPGTFQLLRSIVSDFIPDVEAWKDVDACILDAVDMSRFLQPAQIEGRQVSITIGTDAMLWWRATCCPAVPVGYSFSQRYEWLEANLGVQTLVPQIELPQSALQADKIVAEMLDKVLAEGGEGLILRSPTALYECARTTNMLKYKPSCDGEGTVIGYLWGKEPDNKRSMTGLAVGVRLGAMGGLILQLDNGKSFILSGTTFNMEESIMTYIESGACAADEGVFQPGSIVAETIENIKFKRGTQVSFIYRSLTDSGLPTEARYKR